MFKITAIEIIVSDITKAVNWYESCLGAKVTKRYEEWRCVELVLGESKVELDIGEPLESWGKEEYKKAKLRIGKPTGIIIEVDDVEKKYQELKKKSVKFTVPPTKKPWGETIACFVDLDGNEYKLVQV